MHGYSETWGSVTSKPGFGRQAALILHRRQHNLLELANMEIDPGPATGMAAGASGAYNLVLSASRPTAVVKSVVAHFTSLTDINLIIA